ncbi:hypothetical protein WJX82_000403 [Trebouxia sp. C0006]
MPPVCAGAAADTSGSAPFSDGTDDEVQLLHSQLAEWLTHAAVGNRVFSRKAQESGDEAIILQADVMQMSYNNPCLAASILNSPEYLRACLIRLLVQQGLMPSMLHRLWLRPVQVPLPLMNPYELQQLVTHGSQPQPVRFQGICTAVSTVTKQVYARHVRCCFCDAEGDHLEGHAVSCCIGRQQQPNGYEEDLTCRQYVPVQQIWLGALHPADTQSFTVRAGQVLVQLLEQDLCTAVAIGDVVDIVGQASVNSQPSKANSKLLGDTQVMASSLSVVQLSIVEPDLHPPPQWNQDRLLDALCDRLEACLTYPMSHDLMLALLLSAVSAGVPVTAPTQTSDTAARNQVHVMVTSAGHDPCLTRTLQEAAEALSGLHAVHSPSLSPLLPEVVKLEKQDAAVEPAAVRILGGSLASNNKGILLLNSFDIKKADRDVLGAALNKGRFELQQAPKSMRAKGAKIVDQLDVSSSCKPYFSQSQHLPKAMLDKLQHMHEFLTDYTRHTTIEQ